MSGDVVVGEQYIVGPNPHYRIDGWVHNPRGLDAEVAFEGSRVVVTAGPDTDGDVSISLASSDERRTMINPDCLLPVDGVPRVVKLDEVRVGDRIAARRPLNHGIDAVLVREGVVSEVTGVLRSGDQALVWPDERDRVIITLLERPDPTPAYRADDVRVILVDGMYWLRSAGGGWISAAGGRQNINAFDNRDAEVIATDVDL